MIWFVYLIFTAATIMPLNLEIFYLPSYFKVNVKVTEIFIFLVVIWTY